jgi:hypothetical protein
MKISILVAVVATATMLTACGSKSDDKGAAVAAKDISKTTQSDLSISAWLSECQTHVTSPSLVGAGSERTRLEFNGNKLDVSVLEYTTADCVGDSKVTGVEHKFISAKSKGGKIFANVYDSKVARKSYDVDPTLAQGKLFAKIAMKIDSITLTITGNEALAGVYTREVDTTKSSQNFGGEYNPSSDNGYDTPAIGLPTYGGPR